MSNEIKDVINELSNSTEQSNSIKESSDSINTQMESIIPNFDMASIKEVLQYLHNTEPIDIAHAEMLQQQTLRVADLLSDYLSFLVTQVSLLETSINVTKNKAALNYQSSDGGRVTIEMRKFAAESSSEAEILAIKLAKIKGCKTWLDKKYDIIMKSHYYYKEIVAGFRKTFGGTGNGYNPEQNPSGF